MTDLKREIARVPKTAAGRRIFGKSLRERIVRAALEQQELGRPMTKIAADLGVREQLLGGWVRKAGGSSPVRAVELVEEPRSAVPATDSTSELRVRLPSGAVIEGLSLSDVSELIRQAQ